MKLFALALALLAAPVFAAGLEVQPVTDNTYALVGPLGQRSPENFGNNATFGVVVTPAGVVLIDAGASWKGAADIDAAIDTITDQPVKVLINTGGQDHRWFGNGYWQAQGVQIITSADALADQHARFDEQMQRLDFFLKDAADGTEAIYADTVFDSDYNLTLGGVEMQVIHPGAAHTAGDSFVWLPKAQVVFAGDIVFTERMLGVQPHSIVKDWIASFEAMAAYAPQWVIPGHGHAGPLSIATHDTYDYLVNLRTKIGALIDAGGDIYASTKIDQSAFDYLRNSEVWEGKNAQQTFEQMEWE